MFSHKDTKGTKTQRKAASNDFSLRPFFVSLCLCVFVVKEVAHGQEKTTKTSSKVTLTTKDKKTLGSIRGLADSVVQSAERGRAPHVDIPSRSLSNVRFNQSKRIIEMGTGRSRRELSIWPGQELYADLLVGSGCKQLIEQGKTTSIRGLFYLLKHTIEGTSEETFDTQSECDPVIEDVEVSLDSMREELHLYAKNAGAMVGPITLVDSGDEIDCSRMGSGGYSIPSIVEEEIVQFKKNSAKFVLHVEKDTVWRRFNEDKFWRLHNCILTTGAASRRAVCGACCTGCTTS